MNKEKDQVEKDKQANKTITLIMIGVLVLLLGAGFGYRYYFLRVETEKKSDDQATELDQSNEPSSDNSSANSVSSLDSQIKTDPNNPLLYAEKSELLYNQGNKEAALDAVNQGLAVNPDSDLLKSKKDVLEKDFFQSSSEETPRQ